MLKMEDSYFKKNSYACTIFSIFLRLYKLFLSYNLNLCQTLFPCSVGSEVFRTELFVWFNDSKLLER